MSRSPSIRSRRAVDRVARSQVPASRWRRSQGRTLVLALAFATGTGGCARVVASETADAGAASDHATGSSSNHVASGAGGSGGTATAQGGQGGQTIDECAGYVGLDSPEALAATPRANADAEVLAYEATGRLTAPEDVYQRVVADLAQIRAHDPALEAVHAVPTNPVLGAEITPNLDLTFDDAGIAEVIAGTYPDWRCPNRYYGATPSPPNIRWASVGVTFGDRRYDPALIRSVYAELPHVELVINDGRQGQLSDACLSIAGEAYDYVFAIASQCGADNTCFMREFHGYRSDGSSIVELGRFTFPGDARPAWFTALAECTAHISGCPHLC